MRVCAGANAARCEGRNVARRQGRSVAAHGLGRWARRRVTWRLKKLHLAPIGRLAAEDHRLRLDALELARLEVAEDRDTPAAHLLDRDVLHQPGDDLPRLPLAQVDLLDVQSVGLLMACHLQWRRAVRGGSEAEAEAAPLAAFHLHELARHPSPG